MRAKHTKAPAQGRKSTSFSRLQVADVMRREVLGMGLQAAVSQGIRQLVKHKADALLVVDRNNLPAGVITKTEIMGAYYARLGLDAPLADIMGAPVICCGETDSLESALVTMQQIGIHRVYVTDGKTGRALGSVSYPDIVGALYRYCCDCDFSHRSTRKQAEGLQQRLRVADIMTRTVATAFSGEQLTVVIEKLAAYRIGALLIVDKSGLPVGVISKTDLALAFLREIDLAESAEAIMRGPVSSAHENTPLEDAIRQMIFSEIGRLFLVGESGAQVTGVLTISDAARARSGSCQACTSARIIPKA